MKIKIKILSTYIKSNKKLLRDNELQHSQGFVSYHKVHKSKKTYCRKDKHKNYDE